MPGAKNFTVEDKRVAIGLWKGGLPLSKIREQLQMSKASLKRILATARKNPTLLRSLVESMPRRLQEVISKAGNTTKY